MATPLPPPIAADTAADDAGTGHAQSPFAGAALATPSIARRLTAVRRAGMRQAEWLGVAGLLVLLGAAALYLLGGGLLIGQDALTQFYPWYTFLGERLRAGDLPGWNPAQFGGAPFAGDPQSGWTYVPAMVLFTVFPFWLASPIFITLHIALALGATYALARRLDLSVFGSLAAAASYAYAGPILGRAPCCPPIVQVASWVPVTLLGLELALSARTDLRRVSGAVLSGFALSQILAGWIGQGAYYALLALGVYAAYRTLIEPPHDPDRPPPAWPVRIRRLVIYGGAVLAIGFSLAAAGILPRLEYNPLSNLAGGEYTGPGAWAAVVGGVTADRLRNAFGPGFYYPGAATLPLALLALVLARRRLAVPYAAVIAIGAAILVIPVRTPLHALLYEILPRFESLHRHFPERITMVAYIAPALLAGTAVGSLGRWRRLQHRLLWAVAVPVAIGLGLLVFDVEPTRSVLVIIATGLLVAAVLLPVPVARLVPGLLLLLIAGDLMAANLALSERGPFGGYHRLDLHAYATPTGAAEYLKERTAEEPARFFGHDLGLGTLESGRSTLYRSRFADPGTAALLVNNRATLLDLEDIQGYNPVQPARFVDYLLTLNGAVQEYHDANVLPGGLSSPMLDLLNVRFVVVPANVPPGRDDLVRLRDALPTVYADDEVRVLERATALPRAWLVHEAERTTTEEALNRLAAGTVDPRQVALIEREPPELAPASDPAADRATIVSYEPDRVVIDTISDAPALLMIADGYYPAWKAMVDGEGTAVIPADAMMRAVPVPAGAHRVVLEFESRALILGSIISVVAALAVAAWFTVVAWRERHRATSV